MTIIKATTKKGQTMLASAKNHEGSFLWQVYGKASQAKQNAWEWCYNRFVDEGGRNFRIISHNTFSFSVAWETDKGTRIETANNSYLIA